MVEEEHFDLPEAVEDAIEGLFPGHEIEMQPVGYGYAPGRYIRALFRKDKQIVRAVIKRSRSAAGFHTERLMYGEVLDHIPIRTAKLYSAVSDPDSNTHWLLLEDIGSEVVSLNVNDESRRDILIALAILHTEGVKHVSTDVLIPRFPTGHEFYNSWEETLNKGVRSQEYGLGDIELSALKSLRGYVQSSPLALVHGDADTINAIQMDSGIGIVDFEQSCIGPPLIDLGRLAVFEKRYDDIETYRKRYNGSSGSKLTQDDAERLVDYGLLYEAMRWTCYYIGKTEDDADGGARDNACRAAERLRRAALSELLRESSRRANA